jgi:glycosyltransferase involved in cell wall biosynthesis
VKIALCLEYPLAQHGGTEILVTELIRGLHPHHEIVLVSADDPASLARSAESSNIHKHIQWKSESRSIESAVRLAQEIANTSPDIVHFHFGGNYAWRNRAFTKSPVVHARRLGLRCMSTNHGAFSIFEGYCWDQRSFLVKLALLPIAWLSKQYVLSHLITEVAVSKNDYHALCRWYFPMRSKFRYLYHSRTREDFVPERPVDREKIVLCAGTVARRKGQTFLVEAFCRVASILPDWQLVMIGRDGDAQISTRIRQLIASHRLESRVHMLGPRSDDELHAWLARSAIFVMPSLYEGLGLALQEALFYGCACIGTRCGGVADCWFHRRMLMLWPTRLLG